MLSSRRSPSRRSCTCARSIAIAHAVLADFLDAGLKRGLPGPAGSGQGDPCPLDRVNRDFRAALHLSNRTGRRLVSCEPKGTDRYGRTLAICFEDGEDLNGMMVRDGMAMA